MRSVMLDAEKPHTTPVADLCRRCREETARYRRREAHDDRVCLDLIRRAIAERDEACWEGLVQVYGEQVAAWCRRAGGDAADVDELTAVTWTKFWQSFTAEKFTKARSTAGVLRYLQMCAQSAVLDAVRARSRDLPSEGGHSHRWDSESSSDEALASYADPTPTPEETVAARAAGAEAWQLIRNLLRTERERVLVYLMYEIDLSSAQIQAKRPDLFSSIKDVYTTTRNVHERLGRSAELRAWLAHERE